MAMAAKKQPQLNEAYYGPSIPHRRVDCGLFAPIFNLLLTIVIILGIPVFLIWLLVRPNMVKFHVTDASLSQFNYTTNSTLVYNLALNITVRNPNRKVGIYYDNTEATASYQDAWFDSKSLAPFYQGQKTTRVLKPVFVGQRFLVLDSQKASKFNRERSSGNYNIDVTLHLKVRFDVGGLMTFKLKPKVKCDLSVPLTTPNGILSAGGFGFQTTKCDLNYLHL